MAFSSNIASRLVVLSRSAEYLPINHCFTRYAASAASCKDSIRGSHDTLVLRSTQGFQVRGALVLLVYPQITQIDL